MPKKNKSSARKQVNGAVDVAVDEHLCNDMEQLSTRYTVLSAYRGEVGEVRPGEVNRPQH